MRDRHITRRSFIGALTAFPLLAQDQENVQVLDVQQQQLSADRRIYLVRFKYDFHQQRPVKISGFGQVPPTGEFKYYVYDPVLEFQAIDGKPPLRITLTPTSTTMGAANAEPPGPDRFPAATKNGSWSGTAAQFSVHMLKVLGVYFPFGTIAVAPAAGTDRIETTWRTMETDEQNLYAHVAVLLSRPDSPGPNGIDFRLQYIAQESRARTERRDLVTPAALNRVTKFLADLVADLQKVS